MGRMRQLNTPRRVMMSAAEWVLGRPLLKLAEDPVAAGHLIVGEHSCGIPTVNVYRGDTGKVRIGKFSAIAADVEVFVGGNHRTDWVSSYPFRIMFELPGALQDSCPASKGDVVIGRDVWIGKGAKILSGVEIGNGAVVGAYAVVARDVRPYALVVGNPAAEVRRRFTDEQIELLEKIAWWDWPLEQILEAVPLLNDGHIEAFIERWGPSPGA